MRVEVKMPDTAPGNKQSTKYGLKDLWNEFSHSTGLHAVDKVKPPSFKPLSIRGLLWVLAICSTTGFLIYNLIDELEHYFSYPSITKVTAKMTPFVEFPAVTICNRCTLNRTRLHLYPDVENYFFNISKKMNSNVSFSEPTSDFFHKPLSVEWWRNVSMEGTGMLVSCSFGGVDFDCMSRFRPVFTNAGLCHAFNYNESEIVQAWTAGDDANLVLLFNINQNDYTYRANMAAGIKVLLNNPRLHPDASPTVVMASPGFSTYVALQTQEFTYLPSPYKAFGRQECMDTTNPMFVNPLKYYSPYTYDHCFMECVRVRAFNECGCVGPADPLKLILTDLNLRTNENHNDTKWTDSEEVVFWFGVPFVDMSVPDCLLSNLKAAGCRDKVLRIKQYLSRCSLWSYVPDGECQTEGGRICSLVKQYNCYTTFVKTMSKNGAFIEECACVGECSLQRFSAQVSSSSFPARIWTNSVLNTTRARDRESMMDNFLELRVFYDLIMVTSTTQQAQYTAASLFSNIGGQIGLCLGASILTVAEITELLVFIILFLWDKCRGRRARNRISNW